MLTLVGLNLRNLKDRDVGVGTNVQHIDLSGNVLSDGSELAMFPNLRTLVIDGNEFDDIESIPVLKHLQTFSANKNHLGNLQKFLDDAFDRFGNLKNLSLLKNPLNPYFQSEVKYAAYRDRIFDRFPKLKTLDGCPVEIIKKQLAEQRKVEQQKYQRLTANAVVDEKYSSDQVKSVKTKSEGNRYLRNNQL